MKSNTVWKICCGLVILIAILTMTPLIIPQGIYKPEFMGMPFTLWAGIGISSLLWVITYIAVQNHPGNKN